MDFDDYNKVLRDIETEKMVRNIVHEECEKVRKQSNTNANMILIALIVIESILLWIK